jgi:hypothetical protein
MPEPRGQGGGGALPQPPIFGKKIKPIQPGERGQILPTLYYWDSQIFSPSGIPGMHGMMLQSKWDNSIILFW